MRNSIQALCQSTNPLGKSIGFVTEDIHQMVKEFQTYKEGKIEQQAKLNDQQRAVENNLKAQREELAVAEEKIREYNAKIQNLRRQIIWNDTTIQNLLSSVISSS